MSNSFPGWQDYHSRYRPGVPESVLAASVIMPETPDMHHYIGLMSGTSLDGIDTVLVTVDEHNQIHLAATHHHPLPEVLRSEIQTLMQPGPDELDREGRLDMLLGRLFAEAVMSLLAQSKMAAKQIRAIGSHGQTVRHRPRDDIPFTRQIGNPSVIAELTGITTVADFRTRDMAAGGEGAPLVPAFHATQFRQPGINRAIANIGGIANLTWLPGDLNQPVTGFDTGPGNTLLDLWIVRHQQVSYDINGGWSAGGHVLEPLLSDLLADSYFSLPAPKSTGREYFHLDWLTSRIHNTFPPRDVQATLAELTARTIAASATALLAGAPGEIFVCGGGAHNQDLLSRLQRCVGDTPVRTTAALSLDPDWIEATAFAWLAHQTLSGHPGNLPSVTGARHPTVLGGIYLS